MNDSRKSVTVSVCASQLQGTVDVINTLSGLPLCRCHGDRNKNGRVGRVSKELANWGAVAPKKRWFLLRVLLAEDV